MRHTISFCHYYSRAHLICAGLWTSRVLTNISSQKQEGAAVEGPPAMGPSLQLSTDRRRERPLPWQRGHPGQGGKGSLRHLPNIKLIGQQAAKLWGFFANNAISRRDLDLWPLDLVIGPGVLVSQGPFLPSFLYVGLFVFPLGGGTGRTDGRTDGQTDRQTDGRIGSIHNGASF